MKKTVIRNGIMGGIIVAAVLAAGTIYCYNTGRFEGNMVLGYASMLLAFSFIFVGLKQLRDKQYGGVISFGKAFKAALLITLVTSTIYVLTWLVCYYFFMPDFMEQYSAYILKKATEDGLSAAEIAKKTEEIKMYAGLYKNPLGVILLTYMEILPVGIIVSVAAALIIKRKEKKSLSESPYKTVTA